MNERIKQLADEAAKYSATMALPTGESGNELFVEKFAELIVKECSTLCVSRTSTSDDYNAGRMHCADDIKKSFGIR